MALNQTAFKMWKREEVPKRDRVEIKPYQERESLLKRNEALAFQLGEIVTKYKRLQHILRKLQREKYAHKVDVATQTDEEEQAALPQTPIQASLEDKLASIARQLTNTRSLRATYVSPKQTFEIYETPSSSSRPEPSDRSPIAAMKLYDTLEESALNVSVSEPPSTGRRARRRSVATPVSYSEPSLRAKIRKGHKFFVVEEERGAG